MKVKLNPVNLDEIQKRQVLFEKIALKLLPDFHKTNQLNDWLLETEACSEMLLQKSRSWALLSQAGLQIKKI